MSAGGQPSLVMERRGSTGAGIAAPPPQPLGLVLPITTREARPRTSSLASIASVFSSGAPRKSTACSVIMPTDTGRRRTSSVISVTTIPRKETWANIQTPESHWHPSCVAGLSFGVPAVEVEEPMRRRASSLLSVRSSLQSTQAVVTQAQPAAVSPALASASPVPAPAPVQAQAPVQVPAAPSQLQPLPLSYTMVQQPTDRSVNTTLTASLPSQLSPQPAPVVYDMSSTAPAAAPMVMPAHQMLPNQAMQMPYGYMQAPGGGYILVPAAHMPTAVQWQAQPIQLHSLITEAAVPGTMVQVGTTYLATPTVVSAVPGQEPVTTVMLRNIPQKYDRETLLEVLNNTGFAGSFDFFYLPIDFSTTNSVGYAFINFVSESEQARFRAAYVGLKLSEESPKVCEVCDAKLQGKAKNVDFYRNSTVMGMDEKYHPILIENGVRVSFPKPTRPIGPVQRRPPRTHPRPA